MHKIHNLKMMVDCFNKRILTIICKATQFSNNIGKFKCLNAGIENYIDKQAKDSNSKYKFQIWIILFVFGHYSKILIIKIVIVVFNKLWIISFNMIKINK